MLRDRSITHSGGCTSFSEMYIMNLSLKIYPCRTRSIPGFIVGLILLYPVFRIMLSQRSACTDLPVELMGFRLSTRDL